MTEDDTFRILKRIPLDSLLELLKPLPYPLSSKSTTTDMIFAIAHDKDFLNPGFKWNSITAGTGWTFDDFIKECVKRTEEYDGD